MEQGKVRDRIIWIDMLRGFCMLLILWFHTEMYYVGYDVTPYPYYVGDVLAAFFFLSGYLFYSGSKPVNVRHKLYGVFRWLVVPYFVFTSLMALPKAVAHGNQAGVGDLLFNILTGHASWFISALIVAEILFIVTLYYFQKKPVFVVLTALAALVISSVIGNALSPWHYEQNLWHVNEAMLGLFMMTFGYFFHHYEPHLRTVLECPLTLLLTGSLCVASKILIGCTSPVLTFGPIVVSNYYLFIADILIVTLFLVAVIRRLPSVPFMAWVGQRSIVYYFLAGGVPFIVGKVLTTLGFVYDSYFHILLVFIIVCLVSSLLVWVVYRYTTIVRPI